MRPTTTKSSISSPSTIEPKSALDIATPHKFVPLLQPSSDKSAHGGRGSGKSHFFAELPGA
jgi:hypothetical protein